jgi:hypothetical protein
MSRENTKLSVGLMIGLESKEADGGTGSKHMDEIAALKTVFYNEIKSWTTGVRFPAGAEIFFSSPP